MINIVLCEPEIPQNTGNIIRTAVCTNSKLHLIRPYAFQMTEKNMKKAGMDYIKHIEIIQHDSMDDYLKEYDIKKMYFFTTKSNNNFQEVEYPYDCHLIFGPESRGLSEKILSLNPKNNVRIPMCQDEFVRCLNLSNAVAVAVYEVLRQQKYFNFR